MAILSNINDKFRVDSAGAVYFGTSAGADGQILKSVGTGGSPVWIPQSDIVGDYLPLAGGQMEGNVTTDAGVTFTIAGNLRTNTNLIVDGTTVLSGTLSVTGAQTGTTATFTRLEINASNTKIKGDLLAYADASYDIGASGANRPRNLYLSNSINAADITTTGVGTFGTTVTGSSIIGTSRVQSDDNMMMVAGQFYIGASEGNVDDTYRFYAASGVYYLQSRKSGTWTSYLEIAANGNATFGGNIITTGSITGAASTFDNMLTVTYSDISSGGNRGVRIINTQGTEQIWNLTTGVAGSENESFCIRDTTASVNALKLAISSGNATFAGNVTAAGGTMTADTTFNSNIILEGNIFHKDDTNTYFGFNTGSSGDDIITFATSNIQRLIINPGGVVTVGTSKRYVDSASTQFDLEVTEGMAFGGSAFTYATIQGDGAGLGNIEICANAYPANTGAESKITFKTSTSAGGQYANVLVVKGPNVGIGTSTPDALLVVQADAHNEAFAGKRSATEYLWFLRNENNSGRFQLYNSSSNHTIEMTAANGRITAAQGIFGTAFALTNGGFATLGSTSSSVPIAIAIDGDASTASIVVSTNKNVTIGGTYNYSGTGVKSLSIQATDYPVLAFYAGSTLRSSIVSFSNNTSFSHAAASAKWQFENATAIMGELSGSGTLTVKGDVIAYGSPSDISLKENIKPISNSLDKVKKLQGVTFDWIQKEDQILDIKEDIGFIAQDVEKVIPELVRKNKDGLLSMRHQGIIPILLEAIKELEARIKILENK